MQWCAASPRAPPAPDFPRSGLRLNSGLGGSSGRPSRRCAPAGDPGPSPAPELVTYACSVVPARLGSDRASAGVAGAGWRPVVSAQSPRRPSAATGPPAPNQSRWGASCGPAVSAQVAPRRGCTNVQPIVHTLDNAQRCTYVHTIVHVSHMLGGGSTGSVSVAPPGCIWRRMNSPAGRRGWGRAGRQFQGGPGSSLGRRR